MNTGQRVIAKMFPEDRWNVCIYVTEYNGFHVVDHNTTGEGMPELDCYPIAEMVEKDLSLEANK